MRDQIPLYHQLRRELLEKIQHGNWPPGTKIPSEAKLAEEYQVSRITVRLAMNDLVSAGYVIRQQGRGSFVASESMLHTHTNLYGFAEELRQKGLNVQVSIQKLAIQPASPDGTRALACRDGEQVLYLERTGYVDHQPIFFEVSELRLPTGLKSEDLRHLKKDFGTVFGFFSAHGIQVMSGYQTVRAEAATAEDQERLQLDSSECVLVVERVTRERTGQSIEFSVVRYAASRYMFEVHLHRELKS